MDAIEQAHRRYERNKANRERQAAKKLEAVEPVEQVPVLLVPKEKTQDAIIEVKVTLPHREFVVSLRKRNVLSNMNPSKATPEEFAKAVRSGLLPLLGAVE